MVIGSAPGDAVVYDVLVAVHVGCALIGFGALALSGIYGATARNSDRREAIEETKRYFKGRGLSEYLILPVPFVGLVALAFRPGRVHYSDLWVIAGAVVWLLAAAVLLLGARPAESVIRRGGPDLVPAARQLMWASLACDVLFVVALGFMVTQPG